MQWQSDPMKKKSVLIVEDDFIFAKSLFLHLQKDGYNCTLESDIETVIELLDKGPVPDIFILDYELGYSMTGLDLCRLIKSRLQRPVIILTGNDSEEVTVRCLDAGADQYLVKPYKKNELLARMRTAMRSYSLKLEGETLERIADSSPLLLEKSSRTISDGHRKVALTEKETLLLEFLLGNLGVELSRETIHFALYGNKPEFFSRNIDVLVGRVRKKLMALAAPYSINHLRSFGYVMHRVPDLQPAERHEQRITSDI